MSLSSGMLSGKVALVTGGSRGIGAGIVKRLAKEGGAVDFTYAASHEKAEQLVHSIEREEEGRWRSRPIAPMPQRYEARSTKP